MQRYYTGRGYLEQVEKQMDITRGGRKTRTETQITEVGNYRKRLPLKSRPQTSFHLSFLFFFNKRKISAWLGLH